MNKLKASLFRVLLLILSVHLLSELAEASLQEVILYKSDHNCTGESYRITETQDIPSDEWPASAQWMKLTGIWNIKFTYIFGNVEENSAYLHETRQPKGATGAKCEQVYLVYHDSFWGKPNRLFRFERVGPRDTSTSELLLYSFLNYHYTSQDNPLILTVDKNAIAEAPADFKTVSSVIHFGREKWIAYSEKDFKGGKHCFLPIHHNNKADFQESDVYSLGIKVGSVKVDRDGKCLGVRSLAVSKITMISCVLILIHAVF